VSFGPDLRVSGNSLRRLVKQTRAGPLAKVIYVPRQKIRGSPARNCAQLWFRRRPFPSCAERKRGISQREREREREEFHPLPDRFRLLVNSRSGRVPISRPATRRGARREARDESRITSRRDAARGINFINYTCNRCNYERRLLSGEYNITI